jgi:hypothetical protein
MLSIFFIPIQPMKIPYLSVIDLVFGAGIETRSNDSVHVQNKGTLA